jgi:hypothetical protein
MNKTVFEARGEKMSDSNDKQVQRGVIVELDFAVLPGHQLLLKISKDLFAKAGLTVDATLMARYMGGKSFSSGLNALVTKQGKTIDAPALIAETNLAFSAALTQSLKDIPSEFVSFVEALLAKGVKVIIISRADVEAVKALFSNHSENLVFQTDTSSGFGFLGWDVWRRAARKNSLRERLCVAVVGSGFSVKGALTSSMGSVFKENPLTAYQDFSGGDLSIQRFDNALVKDIVAMLRV